MMEEDLSIFFDDFAVDCSANGHDFKKYPQMYIASKFMTGLLIFVFAFFWAHSGLWYWREWQDRKQGKTIPHIDLAAVGIDTSKLTYDYNVITADGRTRAASVKLASVAIAGAKVRDVDALVIEKGLENSLLGMSYLGRLSRFEATRTSLILHP